MGHSMLAKVTSMRIDPVMGRSMLQHPQSTLYPDITIPESQ